VKSATLHRSDFVQQNAANTKTNMKEKEKKKEKKKRGREWVCCPECENKGKKKKKKVQPRIKTYKKKIRLSEEYMLG
jgi:Ni/Co efflux regulator RcnB